MNYICHLEPTAMETLIREHDEWDGDIMDIDIEAHQTAWANLNGTPKYVTLVDRRKKLKAKLDEINGRNA